MSFVVMCTGLVGVFRFCFVFVFFGLVALWVVVVWVCLRVCPDVEGACWRVLRDVRLVCFCLYVKMI